MNMLKKLDAKAVLGIAVLIVIAIGAQVQDWQIQATEGTQLSEQMQDYMWGEAEVKKADVVATQQPKQDKIQTKPQTHDTRDDKSVSRGDKEDSRTVIAKINKFLGNGLKNKGEIFYAAGQAYNVNPYLMAAIAIHETGNGTSQVFRERNNVAGMMNNGTTFKKYNTVNESIFGFAELLKHNYIDKGYGDIESIGRKFCPVGAANDPRGINKHWIPNVTAKYLEIYNS